MHELSVALTLLDGVAEAAEREGIARVSAVHVRVGALCGVVRDALRFSWELASVDSVAAGSTLHVEDIPLIVFCQRCASEQHPPAGSGFICPSCGSVAATIVHGRELELVAIEVPE
ncbi:MAG: hydrogenase maturation nickel metallochaperone HypA [Vulcanimicrobiaceae bacterium]